MGKIKDALNESVSSESKGDEFPIVGIGASAGGLDPIRELLEHLPVDTGLSFVVIQHLATDQESMLPEILSRSTKMKVLQVTNNIKIEPNNVYVISPGTTITLKDSYLKLAPREVIAKPINTFFTSLASERKIQAIGIVLSGTGNDGTEGLKAIKAEGGITFAQDPKTAQYPDMPQNAIDAQTAYFVLSPEQIAKELVSIAQHPQLSHAKAKTQEAAHAKGETDLKKILMMLKTAFDIDFTHYKENTINRRITRRMVINKAQNMKAYVEYLRSNPSELQALFDDLLIGVTSFFREPQTFAALKEKVLPELVKNRSRGELMRVWVPGCSTGEEVYSFAIVIQEFLEENDIVDVRVQIFGTDANEKSIEKARQGLYPKVIEDNVSENRLKRFFNKNNGNYQIIKPIRDMCIFAKHDITVDPPFSNLDLIMCRNVLIYFDSSLHERVLPIFHYGLKLDGFLVLGESESIGKFQYLFDPVTPKGSIFKKKRAQPRAVLSTATFAPYPAKKTVKPAEKADTMAQLKEEVDRLLMEQYIPATLLVNNSLDVLFFRGQVNPYLTHEPGAASFNINKIVRKELRSIVQAAIYRVRKENKAFTEIVQFQQDQHLQPKTVEIQVKPLKTSDYEEPFFLITFRETICQAYLPNQALSGATSAEVESIKDRQIHDLKEDLESTKQSLQTIVEAHEATNEELRSAMEEAQSSNEELQSTNEELETAKEELQSSNEELQTLNEELKNRNQDLSRVNDDLINLITNIDTTVVIVDNAFKIRRFTASAQELLKIAPSDVGRSITDILLGVQIKDLEKILQNVTTNLASISREVAAGNGRFYELRVRPYLTSEKKIDGAVLSFVDVTERKLLENETSRRTEDLEAQVKEQAAKMVQSERLANIGETAGMVGHDLRNPLQSIIGEVYLLKSELKKIPENEQKANLQECIDAIADQISYMDKIVSDLQTFVKTVKVHKQKVNLKQLITSTTAQIGIPKNVKTDIQIEDAIAAEADPLLLKRVMVNLITNAIQAMPKGGNLTLKAQTINQGQVQIIVEDTGVGIPDEIKPKIFTPLFTTKSKGQGFGLAVCKRVIEAQGGTITFESQEGKGTKFVISLPAQKS